MPITESIKPSTGPKPVTLTLPDFSGGLNADQSAYPLASAENELVDILNFRYIKTAKGVKLKSRDGLTKLTTTPFPGALRDLFYYVDASGNDYTMGVADSDLNYLDRTSFAKIGDLASNRGRMCQFNDKVVIADGGVLKYWDGTTYSFFNDPANTYFDNSSLAPAWSIKMYSGSVIKLAQDITTPGTGSITFSFASATFSLKKTGSPTGNMTAVIYAPDGTTVLSTSSTILDVATLTTDYAYKTFNFNYTMSGNTNYKIAILYSGGDSSNYVNGGATVSNTTNPGTTYYYESFWVEYTDRELSISSPLYAFAPLASFVVQKQDRVYCNHETYPNRLYYCNANDPNDWSTEDGGGYIIFDGHYKINGLFAYNKSIYIFCDNPKAIYQLVGDSPEEYVVNLIFRDVTAISQDAIQDVGNDLQFCDTRGVISLRKLITEGDIEKSIVSRNVNQTYILTSWDCYGGYEFPTDIMTGKVISDNQYWQSYAFTDYVIVFDQELGIWTRYQFEFSEAGIGITSLGVINGITYIGTSDGHLYYMDHTKVQDDTTDFNLLAYLGWLDFNTLLVKTSRFADSLLISVTGETYDLEIYKDFNATTPIKTLSQVSLSQGGAYHSPYCGNLNEVNFNFNQIMFKLTNIASGKGPFWLDRIVLEANILSRFV
jgi:hypothetical protein